MRIISTLRSAGAKSTGKLHSELCPGNEMSRDAFEEVLGAAARAGLLQLSDETFQKDGKQIPYRKAALTLRGREMDETQPIEFLMKETEPPPSKRKRKKTSTVSTSQKRTTKPERAKKPKTVATITGDGIDTDTGREAALRAWRLAEAKKRGIPAFRILSDRTLKALATSHPVTNEDLLDVPGIGSSTVAKYGTNIRRVLSENGG